MSDLGEYKPSAQAKRVLRGHAAHTLVRELAAGRRGLTELAKKYEVSVDDIKYFKELNDEPIAIVLEKAAEDSLLVGLWIAEKAKRIAEYQRDVDEINGLEMPESSMMRVKHGAMKSVAEELGQLTQKVETDNKVTYEIVGVDLDKLV